MKQLPLILSALACVGVAVLFGMKLNEKKSPKPITVTKDATGNVVASGRVAYVDIDTLEANYEYFKKRKAEFESRQKSIDAELEKMANSLQNEYISLQKRAQNNELSQAEGESAEKSLLAKQQEIELKRQNLGNKFLKDQEAFNKEIYDNLHKYIETYNAEKGYDYILSYSRDGAILFANKELDVTQDIIKGMNAAGPSKERSSEEKK